MSRSLPLPPYCGCGCQRQQEESFRALSKQSSDSLSGSSLCSTSPDFLNHQSQISVLKENEVFFNDAKDGEEEDDDDQPVYYIIAAKSRKRKQHNNDCYTVEEPHEKSIRYTTVPELDQQCVPTLFSTPQCQLPLEILTPAATPNNQRSTTDLHCNASGVKIGKLSGSWMNWIDQIVGDVRAEISATKVLF